MHLYQEDYRQTDQKMIQDIATAINGEYSAISCYAQLAQAAPNQEERNQILEIRQDEINHFQAFSQIYTSLTGSQPTPQITEPCPKDYRMGLEAALKDEQETTDFYLDIADRATNPMIRRSFRRAAADEQNHAVWFLYYVVRQIRR